MNIQSRHRIFLFLVVMSITACGGGTGVEDSENTTSVSEITTSETSKTGVFFDNSVANIGYRTPSFEGVTNSLGEYEYLPGETITFFIGDLEFPPVIGTGTLTPLDLVDTQDITNPIVVNIIRLLQTLDQDGDPDNGITISDLAKLSAAPVDFQLSEGEFASSTEVINLIANAGQDNITTELIDSVKAVTHFERGLTEKGIPFVLAGKNVSVSKTGTGGSIFPTDFTVNYGEAIDIAVTPDTGHSIGSVSGCGGTLTGNTYTIDLVTADCTVNASFSLNSYQVSVSTGTGGSISPIDIIVNYGEATDITVTPDTGYSSSVSGCGGTLTGNTYTTGPVTADCTVNANFSLIPYQVSVSTGTGGSISPIDFIVNYRQATDITVTPDPGHSIVSVSGCEGTLTGNNYTTGTTVTADCEVEAIFSLNSHQVSVSSDTGGSISPIDVIVNYGEATDITVTPYTGYSLDNISGCGISQSAGTYTTGLVTADCTVNASFSLNTYQVSGRTVTGGSISPIDFIVNYGEATDITVTPDTGHSISSISGCGGTLTGNTYTTGFVTANCTVNTIFSLIPYQVSVSTGTGGSISPIDFIVNYGEATDITVTPDPGYSIVSVSGCGGSLTGNTYTTGTTVTADCEVEASFSLNSYQVSVSSGTGGSISPIDSIVNYGEATDITITPDTGYSLESISGCGISQFAGTYTTGLVTAACEVEATFRISNNYYVCSNGSDFNDGLSHDTAWQTYTKARKSFSSLYGGDSILFCQGEVFPKTGLQLWANSTSTANNRITISSYSPPIANPPAGFPVIYATDGSDAFNFSNGGNADHQEGYILSNLILRGGKYGGRGIFIYSDVDFIDIVDVVIHDFSIGIYVAGSNNANPGSDGRNSDITIKRAYIYDNDDQGFLGAADNLIIEDSTFVNNGFAKANLNHNIYIDKSGGAVSNEIIRNNKLYKSAIVNGKCSGGSLTVHGDHTNLLIENNVIWEDIGAANHGCWGLSVNQGYSDTFMEQFPNLVIRGNTVINTGNSSIGCSLCQDTIIENNTIVHQLDYKNTGIRVPQTDESAVKPKTDQVTVRNNVILYDTSHNFSTGTGVRIGSGSGATYTSAGNEVYYRPSAGMFAGCENYLFSPPDNINVVAGTCQNSIPQNLLDAAMAKAVLPPIPTSPPP